MNKYLLENDVYKLEIHALGAELKSVFHKGLKKEILYTGNGSWWNRSAPVLFPIVGRLKNDSYSVNDQNFALSQHGFARNLNFECVKSGNSMLSFLLKSNAESLKLYPYEFELEISYVLQNDFIETSYSVRNTGLKSLPFSIGAHPGFICPLFENESFEDYYLEFEKEEVFERHLLDLQNGIFNDQKELVTTDKRIINLNFVFFIKDAIVFKHLNSEKVFLKSKKSSYCLEFTFQNFPYFGIWTKNKAPFICLEPWVGIADSIHSTGKLTEKEGIQFLEPIETFNKSYSFKIHF